MAVVNVSPIRLSNVKLNIKSGATDVGDFEKHVSEVLLIPTTGSTSWTGLGGNVHQFPTATTWVAQLNYAQDWTAATSLARYLFDNQGKPVTLTFIPGGGAASVSNPGFRVTATLVAGPIGGTVDTIGTAQVSLPVDGAPVTVTA